MFVLPFLHFFGFIACTFLALFIFAKDLKSDLNRTCAVLLLCYALWNFGDIVVHNNDSRITRENVMLMQNIASVGWISFAPVTLCFALFFTKREKVLKNKLVMALVVGLPYVFIYKQFTNSITINPQQQSYGWSVEWAQNIWTYLFYAYCLILLVVSVLLTYTYSRKAKLINDRKVAKVIFISYTAGILIGSLIDVVIQNLGFSQIPPVSNLFVFVFATGVLFAIYKYRFLTISHVIAAENIISAMDEILILLNAEGKILTVNNAATETLQYELKDLSGKPVTVLFHEEAVRKELTEKIMNVEPVTNYESNIVSRSGKIVPIIHSFSPVRDNAGTFLGTVFIARDITLRKQIEDELLRSKEKAEESDKLKSAFLANMSHEIRTPMNGIIGFIELLKDKHLSGPERQEYINVIEKSGERMLSLINNLIDISKIEAGLEKLYHSDLDVNELLTSVHAFFRPEAEAKSLILLIGRYTQPETTVIHTDNDKVYAILINLVKNAIKFTSKGTIEFGYTIEQRKGDHCLQFYVKDTGSGIPAHRHEAVFERFIQADIENSKAVQGAGLGLSITRAYVEMLGGEIWVESKEGAGSTFCFTIPFNTASEKGSQSLKTEGQHI